MTASDLGVREAGGAAVGGEASSKTQGAQGVRGVMPARIALLYESRDGRFCLFEDAEGHLTCVDAARLA